MRALGSTWLALLAAATMAATSTHCTTASFTCTDDVQCEGAGPAPRCEPEGTCSFEDPECEGGRRFADGSGPKTGQCVDPDRGSSSSSSSSSSSGPVPDDGTTDERTSLGSSSTDPSTSSGPGVPAEEVCNGEDDDGDGLVDEVSPNNTLCGDCLLAQGEGFAYWACVDPRAWSEALRWCELLGGQLAVVESAAENDFITDLAGGASLWLGASDLEIEGQWRWLDGSTLPVVHPGWGPGQPDDDGSGPEGEDCLHLSSDALFGEGDWNDDICADAPYGALCKAPHSP